MPTADDPTPYVNPNNIGPQDYFGHRLVSSPLAKERLSAQPGSPDARRSTSIPRKPVGSPTRPQFDQEAHPSPGLSRKPVGPPRGRKIDESSHTMVHTSSAAGSVPTEHHIEGNSHIMVGKGGPADDSMRSEDHLTSSPQLMRGRRKIVPGFNVTQDSQPLAKSFLESMSASRNFDSFLDTTLKCLEDPLGKKATAILSRSASTSQAAILPPSDQSLEAVSPGKRYLSLKELRPANMRGPFAAQIPLNSKPMVSTIWAPPTILSSPRRLTPRIITIPTITTTGSAQLLPLHVQFDDQDDISNAQRRHPSLQRKSSQIPLRPSCLPSSKQPSTPSTTSQADPADIAMSSEHLLAPTKQQTTESCHTTSPGGSKEAVKTTPISISTFHPMREMSLPAAQVAFLSPFQDLRHPARVKMVEAQRQKESLTPPKLRRPVAKAGNISPKAKVAHGGHVGIGDPSKTKLGDYDAYRHAMNMENASPVKITAREDRLVVWHPPPTAGSTKSSQVSGCSGPPSSLRSSQNASPSSRIKLTTDQKYGILRYGYGSLMLAAGGSPQSGQSSPDGKKKMVSSYW